ncbi:MAG: hypothetical protein ABJC26_11165, partial [Gemmatimonadaceae bacterium]
NPQWAPDGKSLAYVSDRTGIANLYLYDLNDKQHYQLTNVSGAITAIAEVSPAITWSRGSDVLAFVYYEKGDNTVWKISNPRSLKREPFREEHTAVVANTGTGATATGAVTASATNTTPPVAGRPLTSPVAHLPAAAVKDTTATRTSVYRAPLVGPRLSSELAASNLPKLTESVSITALMDSFNFHLPDTTQFKDYKYKVRLTPEYISQPSIGYQQGGYGNGAYGGTTIVLGDLLGDHRLALSGSLNGQLSDASVFVGFTNLARRLQYETGFVQAPAYILSGQSETPTTGAQTLQETDITRLVIREAYASLLYPLNRFTRFEFGARVDNIDQQIYAYTRTVDYSYGLATDWTQQPTRNVASATTLAPFLAYVNDNSLNGYTGPISGQRIRAQVQPNFGSWRYMDYLVDARKYVPILFNYLWLAGRFTSSIAQGRDEARFPKWVGNPQFIRGFDHDAVNGSCSGLPTDNGAGCSTTETLGSRLAFGNVELRFPVLRVGNRGLPIPPIEGLLFYDAGVAWSKGQKLEVSPGANYNYLSERALLRSFGWGLRMNLFNIAILKYDYAFPQNRPGLKGYGTFTLGASY